MSSFSPPLALADLPSAVWQAHTLATPPLRVQSTGDALLDAQLPGGGWPWGTMIEILQPDTLQAEWRLVLPALARCGQGAVVLVGAPHVPFAPTLAAQGLQASRLWWVHTAVMAHRLWAAEQALSCAQVDAVLLWLGSTHAPQTAVRSDQLRRLHLGAADHAKLLFVMRAAQARELASPASLRVELKPQADRSSTATQEVVCSDVQVHVLKRRGPPLERVLHLRAASSPLECLLAAQSQAWAAPAGERHALDRTARAA